MTVKSGVPGKTVPALQRSQAALSRQLERSWRTHEEQLKFLDSRPGKSTKERARLT